MKSSLVRITVLGGALSALAGVVFAYPFGPGPGYAGAPGNSTCAQCHGAGQVNTGGGAIQLNTTSYTPAVDQHIVVTIQDAAASRWGFEATPRVSSDNSEAGDLRSTDVNTQVVTGGSLQYVEHTAVGTRSGTTGSITFSFDWTPPATNVGDVVFYIAANAANGNNQADAGDHIYTAMFRLSAASSQGGPQITQGGVVNGASFQTGMSPGAWLSVFGVNFAANARNWRLDEIVNGKFPTSLDGISVSIDNKPAAVNFIGPTQINVQVPDFDAVDRMVSVKVTTPGGSTETQVQLARAAPAFFMYSQNSRKYIAAQHADFSPVSPAGVFTSPDSTPAKPGEVIILYATGFGPTNPPTPSGEVITTAHSIDRSTLTVQIGGAAAEVQFAGVTMAGVWQINVKVPDAAADGDAAVVAQLGEVHTQDNAFVAVKR